MEQSPEKYLIKPGRISDSLKDLQRKVSEYPQIQVCRFAVVTSWPRRPEAVTAPKGSSLKRKWSEYLCHCHIIDAVHTHTSG